MSSERLDYIEAKVDGQASYMQELHDEVFALRAEVAHLRELLILSSRDKEA